MLVPNEKVVAIKRQLEALSLLTVSLPPPSNLCLASPVLKPTALEIPRIFAQEEETDTSGNHSRREDGLKQSCNYHKNASCSVDKRKEEDVLPQLHNLTQMWNN